MKTTKLLKKIFISKLYYFIPGVIFLAAENYLKIYIPKITGEIVDIFAYNENNTIPDEAYSLIKILVLSAIVAFAIKFIWRFLLIGNGRRYERDVRNKAFEHLSELDNSFCDSHRTGDIITRMISDITQIRMALSGGINGILEISFSLIMPLVEMVSVMSLPLALVSFSAVPPVVIFLIIIRKEIVKRFLKIQEANSNLSNKIEENLSGIREVKAYGRENYELEEIKKLSGKFYDANINQTKVSAALNPVSKAGFALIYSIFTIVGGIMVFKGTMSVGTFITFDTYIGLMTSPMLRISRVVMLWQKGVASMKRLDVIFEAKTKVDDSKADRGIKQIESDIEVNNLSFSFDGEKEVLHDISFRIEAGKTLGIMGKTGSGKSALLSALSRRYAVPDGSIFIGGKDINTIPLDVLKQSQGCVVQDGFLFSDTIYDNIDFYCKASRNDIIAAAKIADIDENINEFPDKYETVVGERGVTLSGGQRQRISIARAIAKHPKILLLDDCMSAVDTETEKKIMSGLKESTKDLTVVITAHRVSAVMNADEIIFLENGRIVERGTHEELMALGGHYYNLYQKQFNAEDSGDGL